MSKKSVCVSIALTGLLVSAAALTSATGATYPSRHTAEIQYQPIQAISHVLGSKRAAGYFSSEQGNCHLTLMVAEEFDPDQATATSATRLRVALAPGQTITMDSEEQKLLDLTCGPQAETLEARVSDVQAVSY